MKADIHYDVIGGRFTVTLSVTDSPAHVEGEGETLHEALYDLAEQLENEACK